MNIDGEEVGKHDEPQGLRSMGHCCLLAAVPIHFSKQCMWKTCEHSPQTERVYY
jgi:hypothetical protein